MKGKCKLCLRDDVDLQNSHFLPAGIYRILRDDAEKSPHPWVLTKKTAVQSAKQMKAWLLCTDCEQRLSANGEDWVLRNCLKKDGRFPLASILASKTPEASSDETNTKVYHASDVPEISVSALCYFAASIYWRGSIFPWNEDGTHPVSLGPYEEAFRRYLMGLADFPKDCSLLFIVRGGKTFNRITATPTGQRIKGCHVYNFPMPGFAFSLTVSKNRPDVYRRCCFVRGNGNPIMVSDKVDDWLLKTAVKMKQSSLLVKNKVN